MKKWLVKNFLRWKIEILLILIVTLPAACQTKDINKSYLDHNSCATPCWQGITPGLTNEQLTIKIVSELNFVENDSIEIRSSEAATSIGFSFSGQGTGLIDIKNGVVTEISIRPGNDPDLGELLTYFGDPNFVYVEETPTNFICYTADLFYTEKGVWIEATICQESFTDYEVVNNEAKIYSGMKVDYVSFLEPTTNLESMMINAGVSDNFSSKLTTNAASWLGYGFYKLKP